ncbi:MAG: alkene reductase, partial [Leptolyngbya sp. SIO4C5]|nr:alkene reductase [Leptolyngbya sp. SIO4C5]
MSTATAQIDLFTPVQLGRYTLPNRIVMAPLTRNRATGTVPQPVHQIYYSQRASAGLIISEATQVAPQGMGYPDTPGIHSQEQVAAWQKVTEAVHRHGGRIFLQLWHVGRISHPSLQPNGELPVAPSAIKPEGEASTYEGMKPFVTPRALETEEIPGIVEQYRQGAKNALAAGFDGVEIHSANGYLLDQFLRDGANQRSDRYGGSIENRARLLLEVTEAVVGVWGSDRVGIRLSPSGSFNDMSDSNPEALYRYLAEQLNSFDLAYLHIIDPRPGEDKFEIGSSFFRQVYNGTIIAADGYVKTSGNEVLAKGTADLVAYGRLFIANPDLPKRFKLDAPLNQYDRSTFYGGDEHGYIDYPLPACIKFSRLEKCYPAADSVSANCFYCTK